MSKHGLNKRLNRLISSRVISVEDTLKYAAELKKIAEKVEAETNERQSRFFKALADETRLRILKILEVREMCVCEIMTALDLTQPTASHHLGILENAGLVKGKKEGKWVFYSIADPELIKSMRALNIL